MPGARCSAISTTFATRPARLQIQTIDKCFDEPDRIVRPYIVIHGLWQKQKLRPVIT